MPRVAVSSPSFSRHPQLRHELLTRFPDSYFRSDESQLRGAELVDFLSGADAAIVGLEPIDGELLDQLPKLRIISKFGVGIDNIDTRACEARSVAVGWTGGLNARSVAEMTLCFMLGLCRNIFPSSYLLKGGEWRKRGGFQLTGKTVGVVGLGHVGKEVIRLLAPFGCTVLANDIEDRGDFCSQWNVRAVDKRTLFGDCNVVTLHVPLTSETYHLINSASLDQFRAGAFLINTSRGAVVDQQALHSALASGRLSGAALDVFETEPPTDLEFLRSPTLIPTPHIGGNADEAVLAMGRSSIRHLVDFHPRGEQM